MNSMIITIEEYVHKQKEILSEYLQRTIGAVDQPDYYTKILKALA